MSNLKITSHNQYKTPRLVPECLDDSPLVQFHKWMAAALDPVSSGEPEGTPAVHEPEAMVLGTVEEGGKPSSRVVLLKELDKTGFLFFTNYNSRKSRELTVNPYASLTFYWRETSRSIRVSGRVERLSAEASDAYFQSRPRGSRLGAYASKQSSVVGENTLEDRVKQIEEKFGKEETDGKVPCPEFWGGWRVVPDEVEFWSGQPSRLHDRFRYLRLDVPTEDGKEWQVDRLSP
ncbi:pyridoxamine 5-phosphate oxidase [Phaffia rhodozyma]|uniref:pyridoxal 5'-phosphate synthase n=1 Tax=Phaffia rhodozyma TaxID=264483 RepID=A0A0F7SHE5_PHARH|nr:pyridoxamine 5-phosphate oxidase [Phaffia rhodozyma]